MTKLATNIALLISCLLLLTVGCDKKPGSDKKPDEKKAPIVKKVTDADRCAKACGKMAECKFGRADKAKCVQKCTADATNRKDRFELQMGIFEKHMSKGCDDFKKAVMADMFAEIKKRMKDKMPMRKMGTPPPTSQPKAPAPNAPAPKKDPAPAPAPTKK